MQLHYCWVVIAPCLLQSTMAAAECGGSLNQQAGVITSPNYPNAYPTGRCEWTITVAENQAIDVRFQHLDLARTDQTSCEDYLLFYDGPDAGSPVIQEKFCGYNNISKASDIRIRSRGHQLHILFNAIDDITGPGFVMSYWAHDLNECLNPLACPDYSDCYNAEEGYVCTCKAGLVMNSSRHCEVSSGANCARSRCSHLCAVTPTGAEQCLCPLGMELNGFSCIACTNLTYGPDCKRDCPCHQSHTSSCDAKVGNCTCLSGWTGSDCSLDVDECQLRIDECQRRQHSHCSNTDGSYICLCDEDDGYGDSDDGKICIPIDCSQELNGTSGFLTSPNYPQVYFNNARCKWTITVPENHAIVLRFITFYTEENYDFVTIYDSGDTNQISIGRYDGFRIPYEVKSTGNRMIVEFTSDSSVVRIGFSATYTAHFVDMCLACPDYSECYSAGKPHQGFDCTCKEGLVMNSIGHCEVIPGAACVLNRCSHLCVMTSSGVEQCLCPTGMELDGYNCIACTNLTYGPECKRDCPCHQSHTSSCDAKVGNCTCLSGWTGSECSLDADECRLGIDECRPRHYPHCYNTNRLDICLCDENDGYEVSDSGNACVPIVCGQALTGTSGSFNSPHFPQPYFNNANCTWTITAPENYVVSLRFSYFNTEIGYDFLNIYEYDHTNKKVIRGRFHGYATARVARSIGNRMLVEFTSDGSVVDRGFDATYTMHACPPFMYGDLSCDRPCPCVQTNTEYCVSTTGGCVCKEGWILHDCSTDVNECLGTNVDLCPANSHCINTEGSYRCDCIQGYVLNTLTGECDAHNECTHKKCSHTCYLTDDGDETCACPEDLVLDITVGLICVVPYYPFGDTAGDHAVCSGNASTRYPFFSGTIRFNFGVPFGTEIYKEAFVQTNGILSFGPQRAMIGNNDLNDADKLRMKVIAALWTNMDPREGETFYHVYEKCGESVFFNQDDGHASPEKKKVLDRAESDVVKHFRLPGFEVSTVIVVTWEQVQPLSPQGHEEGTFQAVYISGWQKNERNGQEMSGEQRAYTFLMYQNGRMNWKDVEGRKISIGTTAYGLQAIETSIPDVDDIPGSTGYNGVIVFEIGRVSGTTLKCHEYVCSHSNLITSPVYELEIRSLYKCPCSLDRLGRQWQLLERRGENQDIHCYAISAVAKRRLLQGNRRNKICCYKWMPVDSTWQAWLDSRREATYVSSTENPLMAGHILITDPWTLSAIDPYYAMQNMQAQNWCCSEPDRGACDKFYSIFPDLGCSESAIFVTGSALGDPHITTIDGLIYTMNGWGEYIMMDVPSQNFTLQSRTGRAETVNGTLTNATVFTAFAARESNTSSFQVQLARTNTSMVITVNDLDITNDFYDNLEFELAEDSIMVLREFVANRTSVTAIFPCGVSFAVHVGIKSLEIEFEVDKTLQNQTRGLMGNFNGRLDDEFTLSDGTVLSANISERELYQQFAQKWQVSSENSVFTYEQGEDADTHQHPEFIPMFRDEADQQAVQQAETVCGKTNDACIFDYLVTQDRAFAENTKRFKGEQEILIKTIENRLPVLAVRNGSGVTNNRLEVYNGMMVSLPVEAEDQDNDTVEYMLVGNSMGASIDRTSGLVTFTPLMGSLDALRIQAVDDKGGLSAVLQIDLTYCSACSGHGECRGGDIRVLTMQGVPFFHLSCSCFPAYTGSDCESELNGCDSKPCAAGQNCTDLSPEQQGNNTIGYDCGPCPQGFEQVGLLCKDVNECDGGENDCTQLCVNTEGSYVCNCQPGFKLDQKDQKTCLDIDECAERRHQCQQQCVNHPGSYSCICQEGYTLGRDGYSCVLHDDLREACRKCDQTCSPANTEHGTLCSCNSGFGIDPQDENNCNDIDECEEGNNPCSQICNNTIGGFQCKCFSGYKLEMDNSTCTACRSPFYGVGCAQTCRCNGRGNCDSVRGCICTDQWTGDSCEIDIDECANPNACPTGQICQNEIGSFSCVCPEGYQLNKGSCEDIDECSSFQARCDLRVQDCENTLGSYKCECKRGFTRKDAASTCEDIDECQVQGSACEQVCENMPAGYNCKCNPGYRLAGDRRACVQDTDFCKDGPLNCSHGCSIDSVAQKPRCFCPLGYVLLRDEACEDVDECLSESTNLCSYKTGCVNTPGGYNCSCPVGRKLDNDGRSCIVCQGQTWGENCAKYCSCGFGADHCDPVSGCVCQPGFTGVFCAEEIDPCENGQFQCNINEVCVSLQRNATCTCQDGYERINGICEACANGKWGRNCHETCECTTANTLQCDPVNGQCICKPGWEGINCEIDIDECSTNSSYCSSVEHSHCQNTPGGAICVCDDGYLQRDSAAGNVCEACSNGKWGRNCNETCECVTANTLQCDPVNGQCICKPGWEGITCEMDIDECSRNSTYCSSIEYSHCLNTPGGAICECDDGFLQRNSAAGNVCEVCANGKWGRNCNETCECTTANTLQCDPVNGQCICKSGWEGINCEIDINECSTNSSYCSSVEHSHCQNTLGGATCVCDDGYLKSNSASGKVCEACMYGKYGRNCNETCECMTANTQQCDPVNGQCVCKSGWEGINCETDIDECSTNSSYCSSVEHSHCQNTLGGAICVCDDEFEKEVSVTGKETCEEIATVAIGLVFSYNVAEVNLSADSEDFKRISIDIEKMISEILKSAGTAFIRVIISSLRRGSLIADGQVEVRKAQESSVIEGMSLALTRRINDETAGLSIDNETVTLTGLTVRNVSFSADDGTPCGVKQKLNKCSEENQCEEEGNLAVCRSPSEGGSDLPLILGLSITAFFLLAVIIGGLVYYLVRRQKKSECKSEDATEREASSERRLKSQISGS